MKRFTVRKCNVINKWWVWDRKCEQFTIAFKTKKEALEQAKEWNEEELAPAIQVIHCPLLERRNEIGIHLTNPDKFEIQDAISRAERDLFPAIFCHYSNVVSLRGAA